MYRDEKVSQDPASKLAKLDRRKREELDPFPLISPSGEAEQVKYKVNGRYIVAKPYDSIYNEKSTIFMDIAKTFTQKAGARGTLLIGPKASGKTHLLGIEADYAKNTYGAKIILINEKEQYAFKDLAEIRIPRSEALRQGIIKSICRGLGASREDIDGLREELERKGWDAVQIIIDDLYEDDWGRKEVIEDIFTLFEVHTVSRPPVIRTSVALHTGHGVHAGTFFEMYRDKLVMLTVSYDEGEEFAKRIVEAMEKGEVIPGAAVVPIVTEWQRYVDEHVIEEAFKDFFEKYVSIVKDPDLRNLRLEDLADESFIAQTIVKTFKYGVYRVFANESRYLWLTFNGDKVKAEPSYINIITKYKELVSKRNNVAKPHHFYKELLEATVNKIMELKGAKLKKTRKYRVEGGEVKWRTIEYYVVNEETVVAIIPPLTTRKSGIVVERPNEVKKKIDDILTILPNAQVIGVVTEDIDDRGLRDALGMERYALIRLPAPKDSKLKYFYAPILSGAITPTELRSLLEKYVRPAPRSRDSAIRAFMLSRRR